MPGKDIEVGILDYSASPNHAVLEFFQEKGGIPINVFLVTLQKLADHSLIMKDGGLWIYMGVCQPYKNRVFQLGGFAENMIRIITEGITKRGAPIFSRFSHNTS